MGVERRMRRCLMVDAEIGYRRRSYGRRADGAQEKAIRMGAEHTLPVESASVSVYDNPGRSSAAGPRNTRGFFASDRLPPIGVLLARPLLLALCALLGAIAGYLLTAGEKDSAATATIQFATLPNGNRDVVAMDGATLQRTIAPVWVLQRAATSLGEQPSDLEPRTTVAWQQGTRLLNVTATAATTDQAINRANAVADAAVAAADEARTKRLNAALQEANSLLADAPLADFDAELARRDQIGASLGERQNEIQAEAMSLIVVSPATEGTPIGLSTTKGTLVGLAAGLLTAAIIAVLVGSRGLRVPAPSAMRRLAPEIDVLSSEDLPRMAGELVETGESLVVVIAARGASLDGMAVSRELERLLTTQGKSVKVTSPGQGGDLASIALLVQDRQSVPSRHTSRESQADTEMVLLNVDDRTEAATMLEGRAGFTTIIVARRHRTPLSSVLVTYRSFAQTRSVVFVASKSRAAR